MRVIAAAAVVAVIACGSGQAVAGAESAVGRSATPNPGSVNVFWIDGPDGLVVVDGSRNLAGGTSAADAIAATGRPVAGILLTHPHPDHVGGLGVLHNRFPEAPIYASEATAAWMRDDPLGFYGLAKDADADFPDTLTYPTTTFAAGTAVQVGGLTFATADFAPGESETATVYFEPGSGALFVGDLTGNAVTPALLEGHSCGWLVNLDAMAAQFPTAGIAYAGHGDPAPAADQIVRQREYLTTYRSLVGPAVSAASPGGVEVTDDETAGIVAELDTRYPGYPRVASLPNVQELNIASVAQELRAEADDPAAVPEACR